MPPSPAPPGAHRASIRPGFRWNEAASYLFDIDGTLLNSRDAVHYYAFHNAIRDLCGIDASIDGVPVHGNTDPGILRAVLLRTGMEEENIRNVLPQIIDRMCAEVKLKHEDLAPELCPGIPDLLAYLKVGGKLLGVASGNLESVGWAKLEKAGVRFMFAFGAFSWPRESRAAIFEHGIDLARQQLGRTASVFVVGDTPSDVAAARALGTPVIALATGVYTFEELLACAPDACCHSAADLLATVWHTPRTVTTPAE